MNKLIEDLNWRYATKEFDKTKSISDENLGVILESLRLTPSSFGLQPWKFVIVENAELREKLVPHSWNQKQIADAGHLIVLCRINDMGDAFVDRFLDSMVKERGGSREDHLAYEGMMKGFLKGMTEEQKAIWGNHQVYIALGQLMTTAAHLRIDACPMEGFSKPEYDKILGLTDKGLSSVVVCPIGYRANSDKYAEAKKVRYQKDEVIVKI